MLAHDSELQLRARIEELSSAIQIQKQLLKKLEHNKTLVQRQLNAVVDPLARLPLEISSEIFLQCLGSGFLKPEAPLFPLLFLSVSSAWNKIAISTPALWTAIPICFPCSPTLAQILPLWLRRAGNRPLSISFWGDLREWDHRVSAIIWRHGGQLKQICISYGFHPDIKVILDDEQNEDIDIFGGMTPAHLPSLTTLSIHDMCGLPGFRHPQILKLLRLASNIVACFFKLESAMRGFYKVASKPLAIPTLHELSLKGIYNSQFLDKLSVPMLDSLSLPVCGIPGADFVRFLQRSTPPLHELILGITLSTGIERVLDGLHLIPSLTRLEIQPADPQFAVNLFASLAESPSLLPNIRRLTIHLRSYSVNTISDPDWRVILQALLTRRRIQLRIFPVVVPSPEVLEAFKDLSVDGVQMHIGTEDHNYLEEKGTT
ncbi:hypothetical protein K438DRAFT_1979058 [Mycena galopus ATCC 62051]|nr:hypothetical protein K438DRAFT_1979058 [Mycena galopus ATCC 62051]